MTYELELLSIQLLPDFPSGSSVNYRDGMLYLVGDDANSILILDKSYKKISSVQLFNYSGKRIPKPLKADLEGSVFINLDGLDHLLIVGSSSREQRENVILIPFLQSGLNGAQASTIAIKTFIKRLGTLGISEVNLEGATVIGETLVLSNRNNRKNTTNHIILTTTDFWKHQDEAAITIIPVKIGLQTEDILGISEICYEKNTDTLLITFSSEHTDNAYDDGTIGNSYLGWITNITKKINSSTLSVDHLINLIDVHPNCAHEKIEGLCVESSNAQGMVIHFVSDNDDGQSKLFKVNLKIPG